MPKSADKPQIEKFREAARALGAEVDDAEYDAAVAKVAKAPKLTDAEIKEIAKSLRSGNRPKG